MHKHGESGNELHVDPGLFSALSRLAPGVLGYTVETDGVLYVPIIIAENPGHGDVSRYLDSLPLDRTVKVPTVINDQLRGMLARRGFSIVWARSGLGVEHVEYFVREAQPSCKCGFRDTPEARAEWFERTAD